MASEDDREVSEEGREPVVQSGRPRRLGLIGHGRIGAGVAAACHAGELTPWRLEAVLVARSRPPFFTDAAAFLAHRFDLIVECAGPAALAAHGEAALAVADVWTTSAAALADPVVAGRLAAAATRGGHRLRLLAGAIAGLDGVAALGTDPAATLMLTIDLPPEDRATASAAGAPVSDGPVSDVVVDAGSVRDVARRHPDRVNVAVAAALAGPGLDRTQVRLVAPGAPRHRLALAAGGATGSLAVDARPRLAAGARHPVAAAVIGALRQAVLPVWVG